MRKTNVLGIDFDNLSMKEVITEVNSLIQENKKIKISFINPEIVIQSRKSKFLQNYFKNSHLNLADGIGIVYASKILKKPLKERITGTDFVPEICKLSKKKGYSIYLLGGKEGVAEKAKRNLEKKYGCHIAGTKNGYFKTKEEKAIIEDINKKKPDFLMVCFGCPAQEKWIAKNFDKLDAKVIFGNGGALDFWSGERKRAPKWMQKVGLEWFYRLTQDFTLKRIKRQLRLFVFVWKIFLIKIGIR